MTRKWLSDFMNEEVVHGIPELTRAKSRKSKSLWMFYIALSFSLLIVVIFNVSRQFYRSEPIASAAYVSPETFPVLYICPVSMPDSVVQQAGFSSLDAVLLQHISSISSIVRKPNVSMLDTTGLQSTLTNLSSVQDMLLKVGQTHLEALDITDKATILEFMPSQSSVSIVLTLTGYCFEIQTSRSSWPMSAVTARLTSLEVRIKNTKLFKDMGGVYFAIKYHRDTEFLPSPLVFSMTNNIATYNILAKWQRRILKKFRTADCTDKWLSRDQCFAKCVESEVLCAEGCELYSPWKTQTFTDLCYGIAAHNCFKKAFDDSTCSAQCKKPCRQEYFTHTIVAYPYEVVRRLPDGNKSGLEINVLIDSPESSLTTSEEESVTFSMYFVYVGGNLGVFLGFSLFATFNYVFRHLFPQVVRRRNKRAEIKQQQAASTHSRLLKAVPYVFALAATAPFLYSLTDDCFIEQKTTALLYRDEIKIESKMYIIGLGVSENKLKNILKIDPGFWEQEERNLQDREDLPTMCDLVNALLWTSPMQQFFNTLAPQFQERVANLSKILNIDPFVREHGLEELLLQSAEDASDLLLGVKDSSGGSMNYVAKTVLSHLLLLSEVDVLQSNVSNAFDSRTKTISLKTRRHSPFERKCRVQGSYRGLIVSEGYKTHGLVFDYLPYPRVGDFTVTVSPTSIKLKDRRGRPCVDDSEAMNNCKVDCFERYMPCECGYFGYRLNSTNVRNISMLCHRLQPFSQQCPLVKALNAELLRKCERECPTICEQVKYSFNPQFRKPKSEEFQEIEIAVEQPSRNLHLQESYAYDLAQYLCNVGGLVSFFFGFSFITIFQFLKKV